MFMRDGLKQEVDEGLAQLASVVIDLHDDGVEITGYQVGDAAFGKCKYMCVEGNPGKHTPEVKYNLCIISCGSGVE